MTDRTMARGTGAFAVAALFIASCTGAERTSDVLSEPPTDVFTGETWTTSEADPAGPSIELGLIDGGTVGYRIVAGDGADGERVDHVVVDMSLIGLETSLGSLSSGLSIESAGEAEVWSDSFDLPTGKRRSSAVEGVIRSFRFDSPDASVDLVVETLVAGPAVAFRTTVVDDAETGDAAGDLSGDVSAAHVVIDFERTSFRLSDSSTVWLQPHDRPTRFGPAYERIHGPGRPIAAPSPSGQGWNLPALARSTAADSETIGSATVESVTAEAERWTLIAEAGLTSGWAGSHLSPESADGELFLTFPDEREGNGIGSSTPSGVLPLVSPWRVVLTSDDLGDIVESDIVRHLSPESDDRDWSWVEPGRVSWSWWSEPDSPTNPDRLIDFVDLAGELGWEYSLVDANWNEMPDAEFGRVVEHAAARDVGLFLWYNSGGPNNVVTEAPRNRMFDPDTRRAEMARIAALGVRGIKVDFFHSDKPKVIDLYLEIIEDAADHELLVNFHGSTVPRGWGRTWPNLLTMEAVAGGEQYPLNPSYASIAPPQNVVLAFTRNVVGPMDYTPTMLQDTRPRLTTDAHELALAVVFESPLTHFIDTPETYLDQPVAVEAFLRDVPTTWDDTVLLDGSPDSHVAIARRIDGDGDDERAGWWVGAINGTSESVAVDLTSLAELDVQSDFELICDGVNPQAGEVFTFGMIAADELEFLSLPPFGGCIARPPR